MSLDRDIQKRLKEVEQAVLELDESVRGAAFIAMTGYILGAQRESSAAPARNARVPRDVGGDFADGEDDVAAFFSGREIKKPADAVYAAAGYLYSQYGSAPFTTDDIQDVADTVGLTVPARIDMTLRQAQRNKKTLFRASRNGDWTSTTTGELVLKEMFGIRKGRRKRPVDGEGDA